MCFSAYTSILDCSWGNLRSPEIIKVLEHWVKSIQQTNLSLFLLVFLEIAFKYKIVSYCHLFFFIEQSRDDHNDLQGMFANFDFNSGLLNWHPDVISFHFYCHLYILTFSTHVSITGLINGTCSVIIVVFLTILG